MRLVLTVRDHGPGLPAALKGREQTLFDKFTRGEAESATPGVGLGLAICKAVVDAHRGEISAANAADGGAEFKIRLPGARRPTSPMTLTNPSAPSPSSSRMNRRFAASCAARWRPRAGRCTRLIPCSDGLIEAGTRKPDLLVLDLGLPDGDGIQLIRDVRGWSARAHHRAVGPHR